MNFSERIKQLREENKLTTSELAALFKKSESAIRAWETDRTKPDVDTLIKIAEHFECTTDYLLGVSDFPNQQSKESFDKQSERLIKALKYLDSKYEIMPTEINLLETTCNLFSRVSILQNKYNDNQFASQLKKLLYELTKGLWRIQLIHSQKTDKTVENAYYSWGDFSIVIFNITNNLSASAMQYLIKEAEEAKISTEVLEYIKSTIYESSSPTNLDMQELESLFPYEDN